MAKTSTRSKRTTSAPKRRVKARSAIPAHRSEPIDAAAASAPSPEHWRYLQAVTELLESDGPFTTGALAKRLGMEPAELMQFEHERPDVTRWASERMKDRRLVETEAILWKCAELAAAGSTEHAELLVRVAFSAAIGDGLDSRRITLAGPVIVNVASGKPLATQ